MVVDLPPGPKVTIHIETSSPKVAATLKQSAAKVLELGKLLLTARLTDAPSEVPAASIQKTLGLLEPKVEGAAVTAEVLEQARGDKIVVFKKNRRKNYRRKAGHRQDITVLRITDVAGGAKKKKAAAKKAAKKR